MAFQIDATPRSGEFLMRRDAERLALQEARPRTPASLLLYRWARPTLSLGHGQILARDFDPQAIERDGVPVVRRPTGGRAILHADEWTMSLVAALDDPRFGGSLRETLARVGGLVRAALGEIGVETDDPRPPRPAGSDPRLSAACFASAWGFEVLRNGRKLAGSAQRRLRRSFLHQGTILVGGGHEALVNWLRRPPGEREALAATLLASTTSVRAILGREPSFEAFGAALGERFACLARRAAPAAVA